VPTPVEYKGLRLDCAFRADVVVQVSSDLVGLALRENRAFMRALQPDQFQSDPPTAANQLNLFGF
jgi:hypothetical protein